MLSQLACGAFLIALTVLIHAVCLEGIMKAWRKISIEIAVRWRAISISLTIIGIFFAHVIQIWVWAIFYYLVEEIHTWEAALYFSTSSFTTVGYGDLLLSEEWRLLGSIEAINGMILFGWSTAFIFAGVSRIYGHLHRNEETQAG
jgi:carbon starvation protein CstA